MKLIALKVAMALPSLMLQKPHPKSKAKDHTSHLTRRLELWAKGGIEALMVECRTIQYQLSGGARTNTPISEIQTACTFAKLMFEGKVRAALLLITQNPNNGALHLNAEVKDALLSKHSLKQPAVPEAILTLDSPTQSLHPIRFDAINGTLICETAPGPMERLASQVWMHLPGSTFAAPSNLLLQTSVMP